MQFDDILTDKKRTYSSSLFTKTPTYGCLHFTLRRISSFNASSWTIYIQLKIILKSRKPTKTYIHFFNKARKKRIPINGNHRNIGPKIWNVYFRWSLNKKRQKCYFTKEENTCSKASSASINAVSVDDGKTSSSPPLLLFPELFLNSYFADFCYPFFSSKKYKKYFKKIDLHRFLNGCVNIPNLHITAKGSTWFISTRIYQQRIGVHTDEGQGSIWIILRALTCDFLIKWRAYANTTKHHSLVRCITSLI